MTEQNQYDVFMDALRKVGVMYTEEGNVRQVFERLGVPLPDKPVQFLDTLKQEGELRVERENDDPQGRAGRKLKFCDAYYPV